MDFTQKIYKKLLPSLSANHYSFKTLKEYLGFPQGKVIILRHDVDARPERNLAMARIESNIGIEGTYYFRAVPQSWDEQVIKEIHELGHEIGYHYENLSTCNGNMKATIDDFQRNLEKLRKIVPVSTICMHGSPRSSWDSRDLWKKYDYRDYGIIGEPYFDINFDEVFYLTDTGRRWDGCKVSVRDKLPQQERWTKEGLVFHSTHDIIRAIEEDRFPKKVMMTFHPQRWTDKPLPWLNELIMQNVKNVAKSILIKSKLLNS
ncbi:MAG: hypothetical protein U5N26_06485 [Candidatus Marinimicrobia bacterium]|nr:hypothetical protein [Candidatus Neomarinimicrobiota bacterium]